MNGIEIGYFLFCPEPTDGRLSKTETIPLSTKECLPYLCHFALKGFQLLYILIF
jgi:hypothetical protein